MNRPWRIALKLPGGFSTEETINIQKTDPRLYTMQLQLDIKIEKPESKIGYGQKIFLAGSCFTEHIGNNLQELKFEVMQNPYGILFDPSSVCSCLVSCIQNRQFEEKDFFYLNDVWNSWHHHSRFSDPEKNKAIALANDSVRKAHEFLKEADWVIITLGSSFCYRLTEAADPAGLSRGDIVANCHRAPAHWFTKYLLEIEETLSLLDNCFHQLRLFNPKLKFLFTISPVRHVRDGVVENNRSKARLIEAVHHTVNKFEGLWYFPAYELVIDVLRDYRFYDIDLVHPDYQATRFVMEKFTETFIEESSQRIARQVKEIMTARKHRALHPNTSSHRNFLKTHAAITSALLQQYPFLSLQEELEYFNSYKTL